MDGMIRRCRSDENDTILEIINAAAQRYRGAIPDDRWHEPYMPQSELDAALTRGVIFWAYEDHGRVLGVMGIQDRDVPGAPKVTLIRHAYVRPEAQGQGVGSALLQHLLGLADRPVLIGTWLAATWAIGFYEKHGFQQVSETEKDRLLRTYWSIPERQVATSVVLADARWRQLVGTDREP
jgi:GNAT superfamily N-acetyltransferase